MMSDLAPAKIMTGSARDSGNGWFKCICACESVYTFKS